MRGHYGFINAAARTKRSYLLDRTFFDAAVQQADVLGIAASLEQSAYRPFITEAMVKEGSLLAMDAALRRQMSQSYESLRKKARGESRQLIDILLARYDLDNLKMILRGLHNHIDRAEVYQSLIPVGIIKTETFVELADQADVRTCIDKMTEAGIDYAKPLRAAVELYIEFNDLALLEIELERFAVKRNLARASKRSESGRMVRASLLLEYDFMNLMTALKLVHDGAVLEDVERYYIGPGKEITKRRFLELTASESIDELVSKLNGSIFESAAEIAMEGYRANGNLSVIERQFEQLLSKRRMQMFLKMPLSIASTIAYIASKDLEITNLRILLEGISSQVGEDRIKEELFVV